MVWRPVGHLGFREIVLSHIQHLESKYFLEPGMYMQSVRPNARDGICSTHFFILLHMYFICAKEKEISSWFSWYHIVSTYYFYSRCSNLSADPFDICPPQIPIQYQIVYPPIRLQNLTVQYEYHMLFLENPGSLRYHQFRHKWESTRLNISIRFWYLPIGTILIALNTAHCDSIMNRSTECEFSASTVQRKVCSKDEWYWSRIFILFLLAMLSISWATFSTMFLTCVLLSGHDSVVWLP